MSNTTESNESMRPESEAVSSKIPAVSVPPRKSRWTRAYTIWTLMILSLTPGVGVSMFRDYWEEQVPPTARIATYVTSGILIATACGMIVRTPDGRTPGRRSSPSPDNG